MTETGKVLEKVGKNFLIARKPAKILLHIIPTHWDDKSPNLLSPPTKSYLLPVRDILFPLQQINLSPLPFSSNSLALCRWKPPSSPSSPPALQPSPAPLPPSPLPPTPAPVGTIRREERSGRPLYKKLQHLFSVKTGKFHGFARVE